MAKLYEAKTKDDEVTDKNMVQVEETQDVEKKTTYTLAYINTRIAVLQAQVTNIQTEITELEILKTAVDFEAEKVILKVIEPVE